MNLQDMGATWPTAAGDRRQGRRPTFHAVGLRPSEPSAGAVAGYIRRGVVGTGSALSFAGVAAARLAAMNGRENYNNILFSVGVCAFICQSVNY